MYASGLKLSANGRQFEHNGIGYQKQKGSIFGTIFAVGMSMKQQLHADAPFQRMER
jgi:hypothetical protein